jgi:hypothetical protein
LLEAPRSALRSRVASTRPEWLAHGDSVLAAELAAHAGLDARRVARALNAKDNARDAVSFTEIVRDLETMRKSL